MKRIALLLCLLPTVALAGKHLQDTDIETPCVSKRYVWDSTAKKFKCDVIPEAGPSQCTVFTANGWAARTVVTNPVTPVQEILRAFKGAEGSAANTTGGRGGTVCIVNSTADTTGACVFNANGTTSGTCTLRDCVRASGARTVNFAVAGTIELTTHMYFGNPFITINCQTAPGGGIQFSGKNMPSTAAAVMYFETHDVIVRYCRIRKGWNAATLSQKGSTVNIQKNSYNIVFDHNSIQWSQDENVTIWGSGAGYSLTFSWNLIAEPLAAGDLSQHNTNIITGGTGGSNTQENVVFHHNLIANSNHRNPMLKNKSTAFVSNIVYNWSAHALQTMGGVSVDVINNKFVAGPLMPNSPYDHEINTDVDCNGSTVCATGAPALHVVGNIGPNNASGLSDNWTTMVKEVTSENGAEVGALSTTYKRVSPLDVVGAAITADAASTLDTVILPTVGASRRLACDGTWVSNRDSVDTRIVNEYNTRTGIKPQKETDVGGFPTLSAGTPCTDTDHDGMPDAWETAQGLNPNDPSDAWIILPEQTYSNLERYTNGP